MLVAFLESGNPINDMSQFSFYDPNKGRLIIVCSKLIDKIFQTLAQREANQRIRAEYERQVKIREEKEELKRNQINKILEQKLTER